MATKSELEQENVELQKRVDELLNGSFSFASVGEIDDTVYPRVRFTVLEISKATLAHDIATHSANVNAVVMAGQYKVVSSHMMDAADRFNLVLVMQRNE
jgi:hypothetical protein